MTKWIESLMNICGQDFFVKILVIGRTIGANRTQSYARIARALARARLDFWVTCITLCWFLSRIARINTDFFVYFSPSRDDEGCTLEAFSIILFCASKLAPSEYLKTSPTVACSSSLRPPSSARLSTYGAQERAKTLLRSLRKDPLQLPQEGRNQIWWYKHYLRIPQGLAWAVADCAFALCVTKNNWCKQ